MRKLIAIVLMLLFTANICGATITHHLCGKVLQYSSFTGHKKDSKCCCRGSGTDKGCCKTTYIKIKIDEKMALESYPLIKKFLFETIQPSFSFVPQLTGHISDALTEKEYIPQKVRWHRDDLLTFYCVYRI
ncbi:MAG TPA: hypothetical protein VL098_05195 [Flavipsychrobacter sp.]|nr:hypothetical protein [Flavipsychrobacter sp.]